MLLVLYLQAPPSQQYSTSSNTRTSTQGCSTPSKLDFASRYRKPSSLEPRRISLRYAFVRVRSPDLDRNSGLIPPRMASQPKPSPSSLNNHDYVMSDSPRYIYSVSGSLKARILTSITSRSKASLHDCSGLVIDVSGATG